MESERSRFDAGVASTMATLLGMVAFFLVGTQIFSYSMFLLPAFGPVVLGTAALWGLWLALRGHRSAKGFGIGMLIGWGLLALWTSGMSVVGVH